MTTTNASTNSSDPYEAARQVALVYLIMVGTLGIIGNSLVILVFFKYAKLRTATNVFIINLALCDLIISVLDSSFSIASSHNNQWMFGKPGCLCYGFLHYFFISITVSTLAAISVDRFFYITKPVQAKAWRITRTRAIVMLIIIYIYVLLFTFPPLTGWSSFIVEEHFFSGCYIHYGDQQPPSIGYSVVASFFLFLVPLIVMVFCYSRIFSAVRLSTQKTISKTLKPSTPGSVRKRYPLLKRTHVQTAKMIVVVIFFCVIVWMPYVIVSLIKAFTGNAMPLASHVTVLIAKSCVIYNILIYVVLNRKLKASVINFICCGKTTDFFSTSISKPSVSKVMTSEARNRLSAIAAVAEANESGGLSSDKPSPVLGKEKAFKEPRVELVGYLPPLGYHKKEQRKTVDFCNENTDLSCDDIKTKEVKVTGRNGENVPVNFRPRGHEQTEIKSLSFTTLEEKNKIINRQDGANKTEKRPRAGPNELTKCEARRRAMRKVNGVHGKERKMLPKIPNKNEKREFQNFQNNNNTNVNRSPSKTLIVHSRENSSSTAIPSSANSTLSDRSLTSAKDESSTENFPIRHEPVQKHKPSYRKSKTIGYRGGKNAFLKERLKKASKDPLQVSPSELNEIQNYWKRMSLCLDDINIDGEVA
ncbi:rhodopsin, GQ-coupled-like [Actinia tenebrosa]|uniref:Rhodopsin, GQ-coupled-like n=1 Tax=Actinia tenebrosa TaxID=6105 RepID=A0A6P8H0I6_ACTTE|nr:rhodopsin, GQ-coupled-like [Actinia tenebrosa]